MCLCVCPDQPVPVLRLGVTADVSGCVYVCVCVCVYQQHRSAPAGVTADVSGCVYVCVCVPAALLRSGWGHSRGCLEGLICQ